MNNFENFGLPESIIAALNKINFTTPTPIQEQAIPVAMNGCDILGSAQTGTGKTGAFTIPMIAHLMENPSATALVLLPTRELAQQVREAADKMLGSRSGILTALLIGGESMSRQLQQQTAAAYHHRHTGKNQRPSAAAQPEADGYRLFGLGRNGPDAGYGIRHPA
ncbi:MAG: DEAD/DEAH box helicase [Alphaproteobacteria bacterium]